MGGGGGLGVCGECRCGGRCKGYVWEVCVGGGGA